MRLPAAALLALAAALAHGCSPGLLTEQTVVFEGISMQPGIKNGDRLRIARFDRGAEFEVGRGDVVMFLYPDDPSKVYIKRVVGLPGETVELRGGKLFVGGREQAESYVDPQLNQAEGDRPPAYVKPHHYYVMGDNRDNSSDSRSWGLVPEKYILGRVVNGGGS